MLQDDPGMSLIRVLPVFECVAMSSCFSQCCNLMPCATWPVDFLIEH